MPGELEGAVRRLLRPMLLARAAHGLVLSLTAVAVLAQGPADAVRVRVVDQEGRAVAGASVWTRPSRVWGRRTWIPLELWPFWDNEYELLRRVGEPRLAGEDGTLLVARGTVLAVESGELAGFAILGTDAADAAEVRLDDRRWTIELRDDAGAPVAGMPIALEVDGAEGLMAELWHASLGLTDAQGRLVVRALGSIDTPEFLRCADEEYEEIELTEPVEAGKSDEKKPEAPKPPPVTVRPSTVLVVVEGMFMPDHGVALQLDDPHPPVVRLIMPRATMVEIQLPDWHGPLAEWAYLTRVGRQQLLDETQCWPCGGRLVALVGIEERGGGTGIAAGLGGVLHRTEVPPLAKGETFPIRLELAAGDIVLRARLHDAGGKPVAATELDIRPAWPPFRICSVRTDRAGRFALVLCPGFAAGTRVTATVRGCVVPEFLGAQVSFELEPLGPGDRRDIGILKLGAK